MPPSFGALRPKARAYILLVVLGGALAIGHSIFELVNDPIGYRWIILAALTLLTGSFNVKVPSINAYISVSEAFVFASILLFGTPAGTATVLIECMVILLWMKKENRIAHRMLFNMAAPSLAVWIAGTAFYTLSGIQPYSHQFTPLPALFLPLLAFTALYFLVNSWLVAVAVGLETHVPPTRIWYKNFAWLSVNYFSGASLAALIVTYTKQLDISNLAVIVPLLVVSYLTFRTAMGRAEDSYTHLSELNRLYLSTIETLAMAIDAKDQVTHGHIRRVQAYAVGLAQRIGVSDDRLLKAIEAAALLHDMGKLAVPEYILNKPGKLTPAEFEKMKLHASIGADILSAIEFPYPVVPIVRHHHENWDGTGYPTGLRGTDIPIGARILSVVDCFDALTSDRPYRAKLSDEDAIGILFSRRGNMYDPLVVDTFIRVYKDIAPEPVASAPVTVVLEGVTTHSPKMSIAPVFSEAAGPNESLAAALYGSLGRSRSLAEVGDTLTAALRPLVPFETAIVYLYDIEHDDLVARHLIGDPQGISGDFRIPLGERLSGWVAANRQSIINSDPALDLSAAASPRPIHLKSTLSVPLTYENELVGVLSLYSSSHFADQHCAVAETCGQLLARSLRRSGARDGSLALDRVTGLPQTRTIAEAMEHLARATIGGSHATLLICDVVDLESINKRYGRNTGDLALKFIAQRVHECLRTGDVLLRHSDDEFVAVLLDTDAASTAPLAKRIRESVKTVAFRPAGQDVIELGVSTHAISITPDLSTHEDAVGGSASTSTASSLPHRVH